MRPTRYMENDKLNFVSILIANGYGIRKGALFYTKKITGCDHRTLVRWYKTVNLSLLESRVMELKELIEKELEQIFVEMQNKRDKATYKDLVTGAGILSDKLTVLNGGVNSRDEVIVKDWRQAVLEARNESNVESK